MDSGNEETRASKMQFKHFDVVPEANDHHFNRRPPKKCLINGNSPVYAKIMKEWKILEKNLPDDIYVQVYETRIDLLRAVIIGASGTPYHDGLFFFDILLPFNYPEKPPTVHYHSHGYRMNPNLYESGVVCLSLLNTWKGAKTEMWTKDSSILQVLVSIQGLVLNERPYFNEPGTHFIPTWIQMSASNEYNEDVFILSCKTMLHIMKRPPLNFEDFVAEHFRLRAASIFVAIQKYRTGNMLPGQFQRKSSSSNQFRVNLNMIYPQLKTAFGSVISEENMMRIEQLERELEASSKRNTKENVKKEKHGIWKKIVSFVKKMLE